MGQIILNSAVLMLFIRVSTFVLPLVIQSFHLALAALGLGESAREFTIEARMKAKSERAVGLMGPLWTAAAVDRE